MKVCEGCLRTEEEISRHPCGSQRCPGLSEMTLEQLKTAQDALIVINRPRHDDLEGSIYHNQRINELREFFTERTTQFLGEMDAHEYVLTRDFMDQYQNHVAMTMVSNLTALDIFIKG